MVQSFSVFFNQYLLVNVANTNIQYINISYDLAHSKDILKVYLSRVQDCNWLSFRNDVSEYMYILNDKVRVRIYFNQSHNNDYGGGILSSVLDVSRGTI